MKLWPTIQRCPLWRLTNLRCRSRQWAWEPCCIFTQLYAALYFAKGTSYGVISCDGNTQLCLSPDGRSLGLLAGYRVDWTDQIEQCWLLWRHDGNCWGVFQQRRYWVTCYAWKCYNTTVWLQSHVLQSQTSSICMTLLVNFEAGSHDKHLWTNTLTVTAQFGA